jgi:oligopeptide transport system permease protein
MMREIRGNPFRVQEHSMPPAIQMRLEQEYNLDHPWYLQYAYYVKRVFTLDLGSSLTRRNYDVNDSIREHLPVSLKLGALAMAFAVLVGVPLGLLAAMKHKTALDYAAMTMLNAGYALPAFLIATVLIYLFGVTWREETPAGPYSSDGWQAWVLPAIALGLAPMSAVARIVRRMLTVKMEEDYKQTALSTVGPILGYLVAGSFVVEIAFGVPGLWREFVIAARAHEYAVVMGIIVLLSAMVILANLAVDILREWLDPRTREART